MTRTKMAGVIACAVASAACGSSEAPRVVEPQAAVARPDAGAPVLASDTPADVPSIPTESHQQMLIARMLRRASQARGLAATGAVPGVVLDRDALLAKVRAHVGREVPEEAIRVEGLELKLMGFVPTSLDYLADTFKLLEAQLAGFYEPSDSTMYLASDLDDAAADATLAHELVHALQDQHFDLKPHSHYVPGKSDEQGAFSSLAEGDATSAMADVMIGMQTKDKTALDLPDEVFAEQVMASVDASDAAKEPHVMRTSLVAPYIHGVRFVHALRRAGGWAKVDEAWKRLPVSTEQVLHPEKWIANEAPVVIAAPTFASLGAGWQLVDEDSNGELGIRLAFGEWMGEDVAAEAASGWGGDRTVLVSDGQRSAMAVKLRYDAATAAAPDAYAKRAFSALSKAWKVKAKDFACLERTELGPLAVAREGTDLAIIIGPAVTKDGAWKSAGNCAMARKWSKEILGPSASAFIDYVHAARTK